MEKDFDINMYDFFVIGHISLDENIDLQKTEKSVGGAILYSSIILKYISVTSRSSFSESRLW